MNQRHLEYFVTVVQKGSIKGAAKALGLSQPAISSAIRKLEQEFGAPLLQRDAQGSGPTRYGKSLYASAQTMVSVIDSAKRKISALQNPSQGHLRIGTGPSVPMAGISRSIANLMTDFPGLRLDHLTGNNFGDFEQKLLAEDIDVAFCCLDPGILPRTIRHQLLSPNPIGMTMASRHVGKNARSIKKSDLFKDYTWIVLRDDDLQPPPGAVSSRSRDVLSSQQTVTVDDLGMIKTLTLNTKSIGFLPIEDAASALQADELVELYVKDVPQLNRPIYALTKSGADSTPVLEIFLEKVQIPQDHPNGKPKHRRLMIVN